MSIQIIKKPIGLKTLRNISKQQFGDMVKAVVDIDQEIMAIGGELHADEEVELTESEGSKRENTWGINIYPEKSGDDFIEFDSMINLKPASGNKTRRVGHQARRKNNKEIVNKLVIK